MGFIDVIKKRARENKKTIVLPETNDMRILEAAHRVLEEDIANIILVGNEDTIKKNAQGFDLSKATIIDPVTSDKTQQYVETLVELRKKKGMTHLAAEDLLHKDYL